MSNCNCNCNLCLKPQTQLRVFDFCERTLETKFSLFIHDLQ